MNLNMKIGFSKTGFSFVVLLLIFFSNSQANSELNNTLTKGEIKTMIKKCLPSGFHNVIYKIVQTESSKKPYAINVNGKYTMSRQPRNINEALKAISQLKSMNASFDVGLAQINSVHFKPGGVFYKKGYTPEDALDTCTNLKMSALILDSAFERTQDLKKSLSIYNTGSKSKGFKNGYVYKVLSKSNF